jgi:hypothetical protein
LGCRTYQYNISTQLVAGTVPAPTQAVENWWFGVEANRQVTILCVYLERVKAWYDPLSYDVKCELVPFHAMWNDFPHCSTIFSTQLTHTEINLLANLTGWMVRNSQSQFEELLASQVEVVEIKTPSEYAGLLPTACCRSQVDGQKLMAYAFPS